MQINFVFQIPGSAEISRCFRDLEAGLENMTQQFSYHFGSNFTVQDLVESKKDLLNKLDTIEQLTNSSYEDINITLKLFKQVNFQLKQKLF